MYKDHPVSVPFHNAFQFSLAAGISNLAITPQNLSSRAASLADSFNLYRLKRFRYRFHPSTLANEIVVGGYVSDTVDGTITFASAAESQTLAIQSLQSSVPSAWADVSTETLRGALPWYKSVVGTPSTWEEQAGVINFASSNGSSTAAVNIELEGVIDFKSPVDPSLTPAMRRMFSDAKERERLLKLLAAGESTGATKKSGVSGSLIGVSAIGGVSKSPARG